MLNKDRHQLLMGQILRDIYADISIAPLLGFKGGTAAYFFYDLPRFSVDLDFDIIAKNQDEQIHKDLMAKIIKTAKEEGFEIRDQAQKRSTVFLLASYESAAHNIKIEASRRDYPNTY